MLKKLNLEKEESITIEKQNQKLKKLKRKKVEIKKIEEKTPYDCKRSEPQRQSQHLIQKIQRLKKIPKSSSKEHSQKKIKKTKATND